MSFESDFYDAIKGLVSNRVYPDVAPLNTTRPYITIQKVGGQAWNYLEGVFVGSRHARVQVNCFASTRNAANALARSVEVALVESPLKCWVETPAIDTPPSDLTPPLYGTRQDFSAKYT